MDETTLHALGRSQYVADLPLPPGCLHASPVLAPLAHARIDSIDASAALALPGVKAVLSAADIRGENQIGVVFADEPLLAAGEVHYAGQVLALVVASDADTARHAASLLQLNLTPLPHTLDSRQAQQAGALFGKPRCFSCGDVNAAFAECAWQASGRIDIGGQEQLYLETQAALAIPRDDGSMLVHATTQSPSATQEGIARVLGLAVHQVEVDVKRLGGGFGGKESQATPWAAMAALAAQHCGAPVQLVLRRDEDLRATGKRHPYSVDYRIGILADGRIHAYSVDLYQNAGAFTDLSLAILERSLFHASGAYHIANLRAQAWSCRTHLPPFTAMRGFGGPQAMLALEAAIGHVARSSGIAASEIQARSLLSEGDHFPYGQPALRSRARDCWQQATERYQLSQRQQQVAEFNASQSLYKKGLACMPICFGISFTHMPLNQGSALLHVYGDGSVGFSTGGVEMGQGVGRKLQLVVADALGLPPELIRVESNNTTRVANVSPTAASVTTDINGKALQQACEILKQRLLPLAAQQLGCDPALVRLTAGCVHIGTQASPLSWAQLVAMAREQRISLSAQAHYATPDIHFDRSTEHGQPFAYHVYGCAIIEATLDLLRGTYHIDRADIVHDAGRSLDLHIDLGQVEGGLVQGLGWLTSEELVFDAGGVLRSNSLANYKLPDIHAMPQIHVEFLPQADEPNGLMLSKAVGEPPLMYAIGAYSALQQALHAARPAQLAALDAPLTPERMLLALYDDFA